MTDKEFSIYVHNECIKRSYKTYHFSKRSLERFRRWFYYKMKRRYSCSNQMCSQEWTKFLNAFNINKK